MFLLSELGALDLLERAGQPVLERFVGVPAETVNVFLMSAVRREAGAALLKQFSDSGRLDDVQTIVSLLVMTFLIPCVNALLVIVKERGLKVAAGIVVFVVPYALVVGAAVSAVCRAFDVHFR
jgi:ferrous iron transport protein B